MGTRAHYPYLDGRRAVVAERLLQGWTERRIAAELGISPAMAHKEAAKVKQAWRESAVETIDTLRGREDAKLTALEAPLWPRVKAGEVRAIEAVLKIMERRARLLGLDAPERVQHTVDLRSLAVHIAHAEGLDPDELVRVAEMIMRGKAALPAVPDPSAESPT
jgi:hypothetical protein